MNYLLHAWLHFILLLVTKKEKKWELYNPIILLLVNFKSVLKVLLKLSIFV